MSPAGIASNGERFKYQRHRPEQTLLYQLIERHYDEFQSLLAAQGTPLPSYVQKEFEAFLKCGRLEHGFLRVQCERCHHERLVAFSCKKRGFRLKRLLLVSKLWRQTDGRQCGFAY